MSARVTWQKRAHQPTTVLTVRREKHEFAPAFLIEGGVIMRGARADHKQYCILEHLAC